MRSFRDTPIKQKMIAISLLSSGAALLLACGGFVAYELRAYREATLNQLTSVAGVIAANSSSALSFDDPESAQHTLSALRSERMVVAACIYGADERLFAAYYNNFKEELCANRRSETSDARDGLDVSQPIFGEGEPLGTIVIRSRPIDLYERLARYGGIFGLVMLCSGLASLPLLSTLAHRLGVWLRISPLLALTLGITFWWGSNFFIGLSLVPLLREYGTEWKEKRT